MREDAGLSRNPDLLTASMDGETVMMCIETGKYYNLGSVGGEVWALLGRKMTFSQLVDALMERYNVERPKCETETSAFLRKMADQGLVLIDE